MVWIFAIVAFLFLGYEVYIMEAPKGMVGGTPGFGFQTPAQIYAYAESAGFSGSDLVTAVAIALAESSGNADAYNPELLAKTPDGYGSYGLWQIYLKEHPEFIGQNLYDPATNANAAFSVYVAAGYSFSPWSTFKSLSAAHLSAAQSAAGETFYGEADNG